MTSSSHCLWFTTEEAPKAVEFYTTVIPNSRVVRNLTLKNADQPNGEVQLWTLEIAGNQVQVMG